VDAAMKVKSVRRVPMRTAAFTSVPVRSLLDRCRQALAPVKVLSRFCEGRPPL
jgi:hypothetical protein